jgi:hypothetical protein
LVIFQAVDSPRFIVAFAGSHVPTSPPGVVITAEEELCTAVLVPLATTYVEELERWTITIEEAGC